MENRVNPPFRADHVGSLLRPKKLLDARDKFFGDKSISAEELRVIEDEATRGFVTAEGQIDFANPFHEGGNRCLHGLHLPHDKIELEGRPGVGGAVRITHQEGREISAGTYFFDHRADSCGTISSRKWT